IQGYFNLTLNGTTQVRGGMTENVGAGIEIGSSEFGPGEDSYTWNNGTVGPCTLIIEDKAQVTENVSGWNGGGIWMGCIGGSVFLRGNGSITSNATGGDGGGIWTADRTTVSIESGFLIGGNLAGDDGGGLAAGENSSVRMSGSSAIAGNRSEDDGGAIFLDSYTGLSLKDSASISDNTSQYSGGAVATNCQNGPVDMSGSASISGNTSKYKGGGIYLVDTDRETPVAVSMKGQARIHGNTTLEITTWGEEEGDFGGGGGVYSSGDGRVELADSASIDSNEAAGNGGGLFASDDVVLKGTSAIRSNTSGKTGGGIFIYGPSENPWDPDYKPAPISVKVAATAKVSGNSPDQCSSRDLASC
ncbi:MAG: hypothetical protein ACR2J8_00655, partial [Thermomicrobiales bacterium]